MINSFEEFEKKSKACVDCVTKKFSGEDGKRHLLVCALRKFRADALVALRPMQEINDLGQGLFCFILTGNILKCNAGLLLNVDLRGALSDAAGSASADPAHHEHEEDPDENDREHDKQQEIHDARTGTRNLAFEFDPGFLQTLHQVVVADITGVVGPHGTVIRGQGLSFFRGDDDLIRLKIDPLHLTAVDHLGEFVIGDLFIGRVLDIVIHHRGDQKDHNCRKNKADQCLGIPRPLAAAIVIILVIPIVIGIIIIIQAFVSPFLFRLFGMRPVGIARFSSFLK